jgi:hypothetical protein
MAATEGHHRRIRFTRDSRSGVGAGQLLAATLALAAFICLLLAQATGVLPATTPVPRALEVRAGPVVHMRKQATPTATATQGPTPTATSTAPVTPPTIQLISPSSGEGPAGAHLTIRGANFTGSKAHLFGSTGADCSVSSGTLTTANVSGGNISATFIWPVSFAIGTYYICADGMTGSTATYQELTSSPPVLGLSISSIQEGQPLVVQGSSFAGVAAGAAVTLTENTPETSGAAPRTLPVNAILDGNGNFSATWTVDGPYTGAVTIKAYAESEGSSPAVLQASATVTIQPAATPTAVASATPSVGTAAGGTSTSTSASSGSGSTGAALLIILLITGIILTLLVIVGIVIFLALQRRGGRHPVPGAGQGPGPATGYASYGGYSDYGPYTPPSGGQVAEWNESEAEPGLNWRPRPMTGYYPEFDIGQADPPPPGPVSGWSPSRTAPADPWNSPEERVPDPANDQWPDLGGNISGNGDSFWP